MTMFYLKKLRQYEKQQKKIYIHQKKKISISKNHKLIK